MHGNSPVLRRQVPELCSGKRHENELVAGAESPEEAAVLAGVARSVAVLADLEQQGVAVTVVVGKLDPLPLARSFAFAPNFGTRAAPEHGPTLGQRKVKRLGVHPRHHEHGVGFNVLHDGGDKAIGVVLDGL